MVLEKKRFFNYICGSPEPKAPGKPIERQPRRPLLSDIVAFVVVHTFRHKYLLNQIDNQSKTFSVAMLGCETDCIELWDRSVENCGDHDNKKVQRTDKSENAIQAMAASVLIGTSSKTCRYLGSAKILS